MLEILRVFDVRGLWFSMATTSKPPQAQGGGLEVSEIGHHVHGSINVEPLTPASVIVRYPLSTSGTPHANRLLNAGYVSPIYCEY